MVQFHNCNTVKVNSGAKFLGESKEFPWVLVSCWNSRNPSWPVEIESVWMAPGISHPSSLCLLCIELVVKIAYGWDFKSFRTPGKEKSLRGLFTVI